MRWGAVDTRESTGDEANSVGNVGDQRCKAEEKQRRERDQRARSDDRVDGPCSHPCSEQRNDFIPRHRVTLALVSVSYTTYAHRRITLRTRRLHDQACLWTHRCGATARWTDRRRGGSHYRARDRLLGGEARRRRADRG